MGSVEHFLSTEPPWVEVVVLAQGQTPQDIIDRIPTGYLPVLIDGKRCQTKADLFSTFTEALAFPSYFGENWDAFEECINDMEWMPARGYVIVILEAEYLLIDNQADYDIFVDIMQEAGRRWASPQSGEWARPAIPFHMILTVGDEKIGMRDWKLPSSRLEG